MSGPTINACAECRAKGEGARLTPWRIRIATPDGDVVDDWSQLACPHNEPTITGSSATFTRRA